jgi:hydroxymethylbilane synthase
MQRELTVDGRRFFFDILPAETFVPAGGQGIIALQIRSDDQFSDELIQPVNDSETLLCLNAERHFLSELHGDCNFPVGVHATVSNETMKLRAQVFKGECRAPQQAEIDGASNEGSRLAERLLREIEQQ